jgi:hypothetical protein
VRSGEPTLAGFSAVSMPTETDLVANEYRTMSLTDRLFEAIPLDYFDANKDERLSRTEFANKPNAGFTLADRNKDCTLDRTELVIQRPPPGGMPSPGGGPGRQGRQADQEPRECERGPSSAYPYERCGTARSRECEPQGCDGGGTSSRPLGSSASGSSS